MAILLLKFAGKTRNNTLNVACQHGSHPHSMIIYQSTTYIWFGALFERLLVGCLRFFETAISHKDSEMWGRAQQNM